MNLYNIYTLLYAKREFYMIVQIKKGFGILRNPCKCLIFFERETGVEPATLSLGS